MIIATRMLTLRDLEGTREMPVHLHAPELDDGAWICRYEIEWPEGTRSSYGAGFDAVQALHLTLQKIGIELYKSESHAKGRLAWGALGEGYGFPVPGTMRDVLIGDDRRFES